MFGPATVALVVECFGTYDLCVDTYRCRKPKPPDAEVLGLDVNPRTRVLWLFVVLLLLDFG
jgi:hypothetical protein